MLSSQNQQEDCFLPSTHEQQQSLPPVESQKSIPLIYKLNIPAANQLIPQYRPLNMQPRVLKSQPIIYKLPPQLNYPCQQTQLDEQIKKAKPTLSNKDGLSINDYIKNKQLRLVYQKQQQKNKLDRVQSVEESNINEDYTVRLRNISQLHDYNEKDYRELNEITKKQQKIEEDALLFDSRFESGNLGRVYINKQKNSKNFGAYFLLLEKDLNTHGYTNWFHFKAISKVEKLHRFYIINIVKRTALYKQGMRVSVFSLNKYKNNKTAWFKGGHNIHFFQTKFCRFPNSSQVFNCLYFEYQFQDEEEVYFATCQPYTYTRMIQNLHHFQSHPNLLKPFKVQLDSLGHTLSNNIIPIIKIYQQNSPICDKNWIVILGRQHPSEIAGSYISQYMIKYLLSSCTISETLRNSFSFIFVPMVNPDGVIFGNSRCNLSGLDLNRHWGNDLLKELTPQTHKIKQYISNLLQNNRKVRYVLDLHGHGKKQNQFITLLGQTVFSFVVREKIGSAIGFIQCQLDLVSCTYGVSKDKECTIRAQLYQLGIKNTYTVQNSYYGYYDKKKQKILSYNETDYELLAQSLLEAIYIINQSQTTEKQAILEKYGFNTETIRRGLERQIDQLQREQKRNMLCQDVMSDSDPEGDILKLQQRLQTIKNKKMASKIKQSYKSRGNSSKKESKKKKLDKQKAEKMEKKEENSEKQEDDKESDVSDLPEKKLQGKLILSKRHRTQQKFKQRINSKLEGEKIIRVEKNIVKKIIGEIPSPQINDNSNNNREAVNSSSISKYQLPHKKQTRTYDRARLFSRIKTQAIEVKNNLEQQIRQQSVKKKEIEKTYNTLRDESLKAMMKESFAVLGLDIKTKKCKRVQDYQYKPERNELFLSNKSTDYQADRLKEQSYIQFREKKSHSMMLSSQKRMIPQMIITSKVEEKPKYKKSRVVGARSSQKKYQKFEKFINGPFYQQSLTNQNQNSVLYRFPVL